MWATQLPVFKKEISNNNSFSFGANKKNNFQDATANERSCRSTVKFFFCTHHQVPLFAIQTTRWLSLQYTPPGGTVCKLKLPDEPDSTLWWTIHTNPSQLPYYSIIFYSYCKYFMKSHELVQSEYNRNKFWGWNICIQSTNTQPQTHKHKNKQKQAH